MLALQDKNLGIGNRRAMEFDIEHMHNTAVRYRRDYSLILFEIDFLSKYSEQEGKQAGEELFVKLVKHIVNSIRGADRVFRFDIEQLLLLMPETGQDGAMTLASRVVTEIFQQGIKHSASDLKVVTLTAGVCTFDCTLDIPTNWQVLITDAERALEKAQKQGRNCVALPD